MREATDLRLLRREMDLLWGEDAYGRPPRSHPLVAVAVAVDGVEVRFAPFAPDDVRRLLLESGPPSLPADLERWQAPLGDLAWTAGPSYVFDDRTVASSSPLRIVTSDGPSDGPAPGWPEGWGDPDEWAGLLAGRQGPWAVGMDEGRTVAVCYTPVASAFAAEAGVWTLPEARGRGWAGIVAAAWARVAGTHFETLFYSTSLDNAASQAVARKLGLRRIGTIWQARAPELREPIFTESLRASGDPWRHP